MPFSGPRCTQNSGYSIGIFIYPQVNRRNANAKVTRNLQLRAIGISTKTPTSWLDGPIHQRIGPSHKSVHKNIDRGENVGITKEDFTGTPVDNSDKCTNRKERQPTESTIHNRDVSDLHTDYGKHDRTDEVAATDTRTPKNHTGTICENDGGGVQNRGHSRIDNTVVLRIDCQNEGSSEREARRHTPDIRSVEGQGQLWGEAKDSTDTRRGLSTISPVLRLERNADNESIGSEPTSRHPQEALHLGIEKQNGRRIKIDTGELRRIMRQEDRDTPNQPHDPAHGVSRTVPGLCRDRGANPNGDAHNRTQPGGDFQNIRWRIGREQEESNGRSPPGARYDASPDTGECGDSQIKGAPVGIREQPFVWLVPSNPRLQHKSRIAHMIVGKKNEAQIDESCIILDDFSEVCIR